jgi:hypothetical protein
MRTPTIEPTHAMKCYQERAFTFSHSAWALKRVRPTSRASSAVTPGDRPSSPRDVPRWARQQLLSHVREANFNLAKAALLVSLEETAATQSFSQDATLFQLWCEDISERRAFTRYVTVLRMCCTCICCICAVEAELLTALNPQCLQNLCR